MSNLKKYYLKSLFTKVVAFVFLGLIFPKIVGAILYAPGATLEPDCPPTESLLTCGVNVGLVVGGGTGITSYSAGDILYALNSSTLAKLPIGVDGQVLKVSSGSPVWSAGTSANIGDTNLSLTSDRTLTLDGHPFTLSGNTGSFVFNNNGSLTLGDGTNITISKNSISTADISLALTTNGSNTGTVQIGTGGAGVTAPDIFALDVKSNAGDPSGVNGAMYYSADTNKFRCYENGSWGDCIFQGTGSAQNLTLARIGNSTFSTLQDLQNVFHSAGWTSGGTITNAGGGTVNVASGTGLIRTSNTATATVAYFDWSGVNGVAIPSNSVRYIGVEYNGGSPQISVRTSSNWNLRTDFSLGVVVNESGTLSIFSDLQAVGDHAATMIQREYETMPLSPDVRDGGLVLGETGTRKITLSAGAIWDRLNRYEVPALNTNVSGSFDAYYMDGSGGFTKVSSLTQWPNTQYDDQSGTLATMTDSYYGVLWFYLDTNARVSMVYGMNEYTTSSLADAEMAPDVTMLPDRLKVFGKLLGKIVFQKSASSASDVESLIAMSGTSSGGVTNHANLTGLDYASAGHTGFADAISGVNSNITSATGLTSISPSSGLTITGGGASTWSTSAGNLSIDSASALNLGNTNATSISIGKSGITTTNNGNISIVGNFITPKGADYTTVGSQNDVNLGTGSYFRYAGISPATFTGLIGGTDGKIVRISNTSSSILTLTNQDSGSTDINRIITGTGSSVAVASGATVGLMYDSGASRWRVVTLPATSASISGFAFLQNGNAFGTTASLGTTDANALSLITSGANRFTLSAGSATLTGAGATTLAGGSTLALSSSAGSLLSITSGTTGAVSLDSGSTGAVNIGSSANAKTITIGNITGATAVNINTGTGGSTYTTTNGVFNLNTGTGAINLGTDAVAKAITIGNVSGATGVNINAGSGGGTFVSSSGLTLNPFNTSAGNTTEVRFAELASNGVNYVGFKAPDTLSGDSVWTLPVADGTVGQVLTTDGSKNLSWASAGACPTCVVNTSKFNVDTNGNITKLNNVTTSFPSLQGNSGDVLTNDGSGNLTWSPSGAGSASLSGVTAATGNATIGNGNNNINWNWSLSGVTNGFNISENVASTGTGYLERITTIATSTSKPFSIGARGTTIFDTTATGGITIGDSATLNTPITLQSGTGAINIGADSVAHTVTIGNTTGATAVNINSGSGGINFGGSTIVSGSNTFTTGTGVTTINSTSVNLAGNSSVIDMSGTGTLGLNTTTNRAITTGSGLLTTGGGLTVSGDLTAIADFITPKGSDYVTTGIQNNVNLGTGSLFRYTGAGSATFTGISGGVDGKQIRIMNASSFDLTISNEDAGSLAANRIAIASGNPSIVEPNVLITLQYDSSDLRWRVVSQPVTDLSATAFVTGGNAFGTTASLGTTDANALNLITSGVNRFAISAGSATLTGTGATTLASTGALSLDATTSASLGTTTATSILIGSTGVTTTNNGSLTSTQTLTASNGLTLTTGALNLTATSGTLTLGSVVLAGASPLVFDGATANANRTTFAITDPSGARTITFPDASITVNAALNISGTTLASNVITSSLTTVGALLSGSIASGFGSISTTNNISTSANISSTGTGTITSAGVLTASNGLSLTTGALNLSATSGTVDLSSVTLSGGSPLVFDGTSVDANKTTFIITNPTASRTITFPNNSITINAAADITGTTLASNVVTSSLTTVGALTSGSIASGFTSINGTPIGASSANTGRFTTLTSTGATDIANAGASNVTIATTGTGNVTIGNSTGTFSLTSSGGLNVNTSGALTGVTSIDNDAVAQTITIGNTTGATTLNLQSGTGNVIFSIDGTSSSGKVQIGNSGTATPDLLVLDNGTADPTGVNGGMYYNTSTSKFRCYQNSAWTNCIGGDKYWIPKSSDQAVTNSTTLTSDTALTFSVGSGETWVFGFDLFVTNGNSNTPDFKTAILGASGWSCSVQMSGSESVGAAFPQATTTDCDNVPTAMVNNNINADASQGFTVHVQGSITTTSAGSVTLQFAENTGGAGTNVTVKAGSFVEAFKVGGADLAEVYYGKESLSPGTVVSIDSSLSAGVKKSTSVYDKNLLGVITTKPGMVLGSNETASGIPLLVALSGRVPVNVSTENGSIEPGDFLTSSSTPGIAMKATKDGVVIGQALSGFDGSDVGQVLMFVKNTYFPGEFNFSDYKLLLGDISPKISDDDTDNGLSTLIETIQNENPRDPIVIIGQKITDGKKFLTDFVSARVTAIRGYFDEIFTKKIHTNQLCVKRSDNNEICINGDQLETLLNSNTSIDVVSTPLPSTSQEESSVPPLTTTTDGGETTVTPSDETIPNTTTSPSTDTPQDDPSPAVESETTQNSDIISTPAEQPPADTAPVETQ